MGRFSTFWAVCAIAVGVAGCSPNAPEPPPVRQVVPEKTLDEFRAETEDELRDDWDGLLHVGPESCDYLIEQVKSVVRIRDAKGSLDEAIVAFSSRPLPTRDTVLLGRLDKYPQLVEAARTRGYDMKAMLIAHAEAEARHDPKPPVKEMASTLARGIFYEEVNKSEGALVAEAFDACTTGGSYSEERYGRANGNLLLQALQSYAFFNTSYQEETGASAPDIMTLRSKYGLHLIEIQWVARWELLPDGWARAYLKPGSFRICNAVNKLAGRDSAIGPLSEPNTPGVTGDGGCYNAGPNGTQLLVDVRAPSKPNK